MPALSKTDAREKLAKAVEDIRPASLPEIYAELFPEQSPLQKPAAGEIAEHIRTDLAGEEIVDLWNVIFPEDHNVWYDDDGCVLHFNEESAEFAG